MDMLTPVVWMFESKRNQGEEAARLATEEEEVLGGGDRL